MYHPTRGGVRGGRDQFKWDDVKVDKHRENYVGHSIMAPVGRWQKGKDLHWYNNKDPKARTADMEVAKEEIKRIKEHEEQAMREALGLAPKRATQPPSQGNRLDKHEFSELVKRASTTQDLGEGHSEAAQVHGLGFSRATRRLEESTCVQSNNLKEVMPMIKMCEPSSTMSKEKESDRELKKRRHEDKKHEKRSREHKKQRSHKDSDDKRKHRKKRHGSDSD